MADSIRFRRYWKFLVFSPTGCYVEFHGSAQAGSPASEWVAVGEFMLKPMSPAGSPKREFWVKAGEGATHRILLSCVLADASDELLSFQVQGMKKREKL